MIKENIEIIKNKISKTCTRMGINPESITIVGACKKMPPEKIEEAYKYGINIMGENIVQDAIVKYETLKSTGITWQMIGHLQTNKIRKALEIFSMIQSVDSFHLAEEINKRTKKPISVLIEINTSGEASKYGISPKNAVSNIREIASLPNIKICGLMTIGPLNDNPRPAFKLLKELNEKIKLENIPCVEMKYLSMGMSDDYEIAIEEGANIIRLGRVIFGERQK